MVERRDLEAYLGRPWALVAESRAEYWSKELDPVGRLGLADGLRRQALALHPGFDADERRLEDVLCHARVGELLRRVRASRRD